jgi:hypothetical protein
MGDPAATLPREMMVTIVRELEVLLRRGWTPLWKYYGCGLGGLAVCSKPWWDVVVEVMYSVEGIIEGKDLLSKTRYCFKLDLSFLFESFEATAEKELGLLGFVPLIWHIVDMNREVRRARDSESFLEGLKAVFDAAILAYKRVRISTNEPRRVAACCMAVQFLIVRTVETRVRKEANPKAPWTFEDWTEESEASILVAMMCRMHQLLAPLHYRTTCEHLLVTDVVSDSAKPPKWPEEDRDGLILKIRRVFPLMRFQPMSLHANADFHREVLLNTKECWIEQASERHLYAAAADSPSDPP